MQPPPGFGYPQQMLVVGMDIPPGFQPALPNQHISHASLAAGSHGPQLAAAQLNSKPRRPPPGFEGVAAAHQHSSGLTAGHVDAAIQQHHAPLPPHLQLLHQQHAPQHNQQQHGPLPPQLMAHGNSTDPQQAAMNQHAASNAGPTSGPSSNSGSTGGGGLFALLAKHRAEDAEQAKRASETGSGQHHPPMSAAGSGQLPQGIAPMPAQHVPPPGSAAPGMAPAAVSLQHPGAASSMGYPADAFAPHPAAAGPGLGGPMQLPPGMPPPPHMMHPGHQFLGPPGPGFPPPGWQPPQADPAAAAGFSPFGAPMGAYMGPPGSMPLGMPPPEFLQGSAPMSGPMPGPMHMPAQGWGPQGPVSGHGQPPPGWAGPAAAGPGSGHEPGHESDNCPIKRCSLCREQGHRWQDCPTHVQDAFADGRALPWQLQAAAQHGGVDQQHQDVPKGSRGSQHSKAGGSSRGDRGAGSSSRGRGGQRRRNPNENSFDVLT